MTPRAHLFPLATILVMLLLAVGTSPLLAQEPVDIEEACPERTPYGDFNDTYNNPHRRSIDCIVWWEITSGVADDQYGPSRPVFRDQMATFIINSLRAMDVPVPEARSQGFEDVADNPHRDNIHRLVEAGIAGGTSETTYDPRDVVKRDQMATFLAQAYEYATGEQLEVGRDSFRDTVGNPHEENIRRVAQAGITGGTSPNEYSPRDDVRRDQMATFVARMLAIVLPLSPGGRQNPYPMGSVYRLHDNWDVTVLEVDPDATARVLAENPYNDPPASDHQFFMARIRGTYQGGGSSRFDASYRFRAFGDSGNTYSTFENSCGVIPDEIDDNETYTGGSVEGNICWEVRSSDAPGLRMFDDQPYEDPYRPFFALYEE